jgi:alternative ribosome-rescue factor
MSKSNYIAADLRTAKYKIRIVKPKKGKGSYNRKKREI